MISCIGEQACRELWMRGFEDGIRHREEMIYAAAISYLIYEFLDRMGGMIDSRILDEARNFFQILPYSIILFYAVLMLWI